MKMDTSLGGKGWCLSPFAASWGIGGRAMMTPTRAPETDSETTYLPPADREHLTEILVPFGNPALDRRPTDGLHRNRPVGGGALGSFRGCRLKPLSR
jgi:hypothetical protein